MNKETRGKYVEAGKTVQKARKIARETAQPGTNLKTIAETIEEEIKDQGLKPAFPVNTSLNEEAAHYTPGINEERTLNKNDILKIDIGAQKDGYIADTALTVNPSGKHQELIDTVEEVLQKALKFIEPGLTVGEFGEYVQKQIPGEYNPVTNLTGHYIDRYTQHAGVSIPNVSNKSRHKFKKGDAVAIEPFITTGSGKVKNGKPGNIYKLETKRNVRGRTERQLMKKIENFNNLPFTTRWIKGYGGRQKMAMNKLVQKGVVKSYEVLKDSQNGLVAQAEHTVLVGAGEDDQNIITTRN